MVQAQDDTPFIHELTAIAETVGPLSDSQAQAFFEKYPIDAIFRELSRPHATLAVLANARHALEKMFNTGYGSALLPQLVPYAAAALRSAPAPVMRQLAVHQLARLLAAPGFAAAPLVQQQELLGLLLGALSDDEVGVAEEAERALGVLGASPDTLGMLLHAPPASQQLQALAASPDPVLATRAVTLALRLAAASPSAAAAVRGAGLLEPLLRALGDPRDVLAAAAALQLVREAAEGCDAGMATALGEEALPALAVLMAPPGGSTGAGAHEQQPELVLQCASLQAAAALLTASLEAGQGPMAVDAGPGEAAAAPALSPHAVLAAIKCILDVGASEQVPQELEEAALDAVGTIGLKASGATAVLQDPSCVFSDVAYKALGRAPNPSIRICALHAVASVAGAERAASTGRGSAALLGPAEEDTLRTAVYDGALASSPTTTPADVAMEYLGQPFLELRVAVYRALSALLARDWMAAAVCGHAELLAWLLNPQSETSRQGCEWRYACVCALASTMRAVAAVAGQQQQQGGGGGGAANGAAGQYHAQYNAAMAAVAQRVDDAVAQGPYGAHKATPEQYQVATMPR